MLFIILVSLTMTWFSEKMLISTWCINGFMSNLIKKSWTDSTLKVHQDLDTCQTPWFIRILTLKMSQGPDYWKWNDLKIPKISWYCLDIEESRWTRWGSLHHLRLRFFSVSFEAKENFSPDLFSSHVTNTGIHWRLVFLIVLNGVKNMTMSVRIPKNN
jgi:hypothetical protein